MDILEKPGPGFTTLARHKSRTVVVDGVERPLLQWFTLLTFKQMAEVVPGEWIEVDPTKWKVPPEAVEADKAKVEKAKTHADADELKRLHNSIGLKGAAKQKTEDLIFYAVHKLGLAEAASMTKKDLIDHVENAFNNE